MTRAKEKNLEHDVEKGVVLGVDGTVVVKEEVVRSFLKSIGSGGIVPGHVPYSRKLESILTEMGYCGIVIFRDPRDVVVSHAYYVLQEHHYLHQLYRSLDSFDECLMASITGIDDEESGLFLDNIRTKVTAVNGWREGPVFYSTRFEDLIGTRGGGDSALQREQIRAIARHVGLSITERKTTRVALRMFGGTHSFRKGQIGGWKKSFKDEHKRVFKEIAGDLLIKAGYEKNMNW